MIYQSVITDTERFEELYKNLCLTIIVELVRFIINELSAESLIN